MLTSVIRLMGAILFALGMIIVSSDLGASLVDAERTMTYWLIAKGNMSVLQAVGIVLSLPLIGLYFAIFYKR